MDALKLLQELLSHQVPNGDPATIIKDSLLLRLEQVKRQKFGKGKVKRKSEDEVETEREAEGENQRNIPHEAPVKATSERPVSRYIPMEVRNAVWERDQGRCAFMSERGRWCSERRFLEFHHVIPFAWGGETTVENLELRCRTHNAYEGELIFGRVLRRGSAKARSVLESTRFKTSERTARVRE